LSPVTAALQAYADRGVFRGFRAIASARGRTTYEFKWLTRKPVIAVFDPNRRTLTFQNLLPSLDAVAAADVKSLVLGRTGRSVPGHKRLDARRARLRATVRTGSLTLAVEIRGDNSAYAVGAVLNLINEAFVTLHERHPGYLIEHFGMSAE
jgi:hypothetical protein